MEYLGYTLSHGSIIECNNISFADFDKRKLADYNSMTEPVKTDNNTYRSTITFRYYYKLKESYLEINCVSQVLIKTQSGKLIFNAASPEAIKCITDILTEIDMLINQFCAHFTEIKDKVRYLSPVEIYSLALVILGSFILK